MKNKKGLIETILKCFFLKRKSREAAEAEQQKRFFKNLKRVVDGQEAVRVHLGK